MALRNSSRLYIKRFLGLNSYISQTNVPPQWWTAAVNVAVNAQGSAEVMRPPKSFHTSVGSGNPVISMADYRSPTNHKLLLDIVLTESKDSDSESGEIGELATYTINDDYSLALIRTDQANYPFISVNSGTKLFRVNRAEFIQLQEDETTFYKVGITGPAAAPTIAYTGSGSGQIASGIQFSYAYMNSTTGHVSRPCPISNRLGASAASDTIHVPIVASTQTGVDKIVFFATLDGGDQPYLIIDSSGDVVTNSNSTTTYSITVANLIWDTETPEPIFNYIPPIGAQSMFVWQDRVFLLGFAGSSPDVPAYEMAYSGYESCYIGVPGESWPTLNRFSIPNKGEILQGGIGTQVGAFILSDVDAYLISGYPTDKTTGPEATIVVSEHLAPLHWNIGTKSPRTIKNTPYGTMWLDNAQRIRIWSGQGFPTEVGLPLRSELAALDGTALIGCEGFWFQMGDSGGFYAMVGKLASGAQQLFIVTLYEDPETRQMSYGYAISSMPGYSLTSVLVDSKLRMFMGAINQVQEIFYKSPETDGWTEGTKAWANGTSIYFDMVLGNDDNFTYWHSMRIDGDTTDLTVTIRDQGETVGGTNRTITLSNSDTGDGGSSFGMIDEYGRRKILRFTYDATKTTLKQIQSLQVMFQNRPRNI